MVLFLYWYVALKKSRFASLKEAIFGVPEPTEVKEGSVVIHKVSQDYGVRPKNTFRSQIAVFEKDSLVREACVRQGQEICGAGFFTQVNQDYTVRLPKPDGDGSWSAKEAIDYFNEANNLDEILQVVSVEMVAFGNSFLSVKDGLRIIALKGIEKAVARTKLTPVEKEYNLKLTSDYSTKSVKELKRGEFVHFRSNVTSSSAPFGTGIVSGLLESYVESAPSPMDLRHSVRKSMKEGFEKFSFGNELWVFEDLPDDKIGDVTDENSLAYRIKNMKSTGQRVVTNKKGHIELTVPQRTTSYDQWLKSSEYEFISLLEDPSLARPAETIFGKSTLESQVQLYRKNVLAKQRILKRGVEALWKKCLSEWGFDAEKAQPRLNFGLEEVPKMEFEDLMKAFEV